MFNVIDIKNGDLINYLIVIKYIEILYEMVKGKDNKIIYMFFEVIGVLSLLGGIKEMLKNN